MEHINENEGRRINKKATMQDVAKLANVALSTVSHVINETAPISEETKKKVLGVIKELNYTPNALARGLRQNKTNLIGIVVPDISNEFYSKTASAILKAASAKKCTTVLCDTGYNFEREKNSVEALIQRRVDGLIFLGGGNDEEILQNAYDSDISIVLADRRYKSFSSVEFNNYEAMINLVHELYNDGFRRIGYISESLDMINLQDRYNGLMDGLKQYGLTVNDEWILSDSWLQLDKVDTARELMQKYIHNKSKDNMPEVFITSSDMIAVGILDALIKNGYKIPEDIGVIGFDNITLARYYQPSITTIFQDCKKFGDACFRLLEKKMEGELEDTHLTIKTKLIKRKSVGFKSL